MFDVGLGEIIVLAIPPCSSSDPTSCLVAAQAGRFARQVREMATTARKEISDPPGSRT